MKVARCAARRVILTLACGALALSGQAVFAGSLGSESSLSLQSAYNSNPLLLPSSQASGAESLALLVNLPITYTGDESTFELIPRLRQAETWGIAALLSDYQYLDGSWKFGSERNLFNVSADWHRDSTLYNNYENSVLSGQTARKQEEIGSTGWRRQLTERSDAQLQASIDHVNYGQNVAQALYSYNYGQATAQYDRQLSELWQISVLGGFGRYKLLDYQYRSDQRFAQLILSRPLNERWSLTVQAGYSLLGGRVSQIQYVIEVGPGGILYLVPITVVNHSSAGTGSYAATLERRYERLTLDLSASQSVAPSGFGALLTQDDVSIKGNFALTERWSLGAAVHGSRQYDALGRVSLSDRHYVDGNLYASWLWTEHWTLQLQATLTKLKPGPLQSLDSGTAVNLTLSRVFGRIRLDKQ